MRSTRSDSTRRAFLQAGGLGVVASVMSSSTAEAAPRTAAEEANVKIIDDFCKSWATRDLTKITSFLADTCVYRATETAPPAAGREAIIERIKGPVGRAEKVEFEILDTWAKGPLVVDDRLDYFIAGGQTRIFHAVGVFYMVGGKIAEWTDFVIRDQ
jgi:limonene-1,2-epoxide hydrolase